MDRFRPKLALPQPSPLPPQNSAGKALLEHLHGGRGRALLRFADQQMNVPRHHERGSLTVGFVRGGWSEVGGRQVRAGIGAHEILRSAWKAAPLRMTPSC